MANARAREGHRQNLHKQKRNETMKLTLLLLTTLLLSPLAAMPAAETPPATTKAIVTIDMDAPAVGYNRMIFGGFVEHFSKQVYGGIFEPGSSLADEKGFRLDVIEALKELKVPVIRWPGGMFRGQLSLDERRRERPSTLCRCSLGSD
jgi:hypothetical protein